MQGQVSGQLAKGKWLIEANTGFGRNGTPHILLSYQWVTAFNIEPKRLILLK
jgi:hypothetical protein